MADVPPFDPEGQDIAANVAADVTETIVVPSAPAPIATPAPDVVANVEADALEVEVIPATPVSAPSVPTDVVDTSTVLNMTPSQIDAAYQAYLASQPH